MKDKRHIMIYEIIDKYDVSTQEELLEHLKNSNFNVTQATVSRDIKELKLLKIPVSDGGYKYICPNNNADNLSSLKFKSIFSESVVKIDYVANTVVIKCMTGTAQAVCAALDVISFDGVVGTLAGDDTIFVLMRDAEMSSNFIQELNKNIIGG